MLRAVQEHFKSEETMTKLLAILPLLMMAFPTYAGERKGQGPFRFDEKKLRCVDASGQEGLNPFDAAVLFKDIPNNARNQRWPKRDAQCVNLSGVKFEDYLGANYCVLVGWDFRGSKFTNAELNFNFIDEGLFAGSTVEELSIGYGRVTAKDISFDKGDMPMPKAKAEKKSSSEGVKN